jgi:hypothetical protein
MKFKQLFVLFLFICNSGLGQVPGTPKILFKSANPQTFTISATTRDISSANLTSYVINNGQTTVTESGILWGTSTPTYISSTNGNVATTNSNTGTITCTLSGLTPGINYFIVAYAITTSGTTYGNVISYEHAVVVSPVTGRKWMAVNLGANNFPANIDDQTGAGDMYQWGRASDGHEKARPLVYNPEQFFNSQGNYVPMWLPDNPHRFEWSSTTTVEPINDDYVEEKERFHRKFIIDRATPDNNDPNGYNNGQITRGNNPTTPNTFGDWMTNFNNSLWQGLNGINNPCPPGFRIPTVSDFDNETALTNRTTAFASFLKLPATGFRHNNTNFGRSYITPASVANGYYWTSTTGTSGGTNMSNMYTFLISSRTKPLTVRATGAAVRCIKN